jgi:hypothetical protein
MVAPVDNRQVAPPADPAPSLGVVERLVHAIVRLAQSIFEKICHWFCPERAHPEPPPAESPQAAPAPVDPHAEDVYIRNRLDSGRCGAVEIWRHFKKYFPEPDLQDVVFAQVGKRSIGWRGGDPIQIGRAKSIENPTLLVTYITEEIQRQIQS